VAHTNASRARRTGWIQGTAGLGMQHHRPKSRVSPHDRRAKGAEAAQQGSRNTADCAKQEEGSAAQRRRKRRPRRGGAAARTGQPRRPQARERTTTRKTRSPRTEKNPASRSVLHVPTPRAQSSRVLWTQPATIAHGDVHDQPIPGRSRGTSNPTRQRQQTAKNSTIPIAGATTAYARPKPRRRAIRHAVGGRREGGYGL
jgi:hypothetical protein